MRTCAVCGHDSDEAITVTLVDGESFAFDRLACAVKLVAIACASCGRDVVGNGLEADGRFYCDARCAAAAVMRNVRIEP